MHILLADQPGLVRQMFEKVAKEADIQTERVESYADLVEFLETKSPAFLIISMSILNHVSESQLVDLIHVPNLQHVPIYIIKNSSQLNLTKIQTNAFVKVFSKYEMESIWTHFQSHIHRLKRQFLKGHLLFVEDSDLSAEHTGRLLCRFGMTYDRFSSVEEALQAFQHVEYDLVLSDYFLEGKKTGLELVRSIRNLKHSQANIPILVLSGDMDPNRKVEVLFAGASDYISKPVVSEELLARLSTHLRMNDLLKNIEQQAKHFETMAQMDPLTKLYNRRGLNHLIKDKLSTILEDYDDLSVILADVDQFKRINDQNGHFIGDQVLAAIAKVFQNFISNDQYCIRFGGEEFLIILPHKTTKQACDMAENFRVYFEKNQVGACNFTMSFGIASMKYIDSSILWDLIQHADLALYEAKDFGSNCIKVADL